MPRTISADTTIGVTLSNSANDSPALVTATIDTAAGNAITGLAAAAWSISNQGTVQSTATLGNGIRLAAGGSIDNAAGALISGGSDGIYATSAATTTTVTNAGTIAGAATDGVQLNTGGVVDNAATGTLSGSAAGVAIFGATAVVTNAGGQILGSGSTAPGVFLAAGGSISNAAGGTIGIGFGAYITGVAGTADNSGIIRGDREVGIEMNAGGTLANAISGIVTGHYSGVHIQGAAGTVFSAGSISGSNGSGVLLDAGGLVSIAGAGVVTANGSGLSFGANGAATLQNAGSISGSQFGVGVFGGGSVTNATSGAISGYVGIYASTSSAAVAVVNAGAINGSGGFGIELNSGGSVTNQSSGTISAGSNGIAITRGAGTVENAGSIDAAVRLAAGFTNLLRVDPGASFGGVVDGGNTLGATAVSTMELTSGSSAGTLAGGGCSFTNFGAIQFDPGGAWLFSGSTAALAGGQVISGFAPGDTIELTGVTDTIAGFAAAKRTLAGSVPLTLNLPGAFNVSQFSAATVAGNMELSVTVALKQVLSGTYNSTVTLDSGTYTNPITVTGTIDVSAGVALDGAAVAWGVLNQGLIEANGTGGNAVRLDAGGSVTNEASGIITGAGSGIEMLAAPGYVINASTIAGNAGFGVRLALSGDIKNAVSGTITGAGKDAVSITGTGHVSNYGSIGATGSGVSGVSISGAGYVYNAGAISGVRHGVVIYGPGSVTNAGRIVSTSTGGTGGVALDGGGVLTNKPDGYIAGGYAVYMSGGGTVTNAGTIKSTSTGDTAVLFVGGSSNNRLVIDPGALFIGVANGGPTAGSQSALELAGGSGSLGAVGSSFVNFGSIVFDPGAAWIVSGSTAALAGGQPISGFAHGDTIELDGVVTTGSTFQNGTLTLANGLTLDLPGTGYQFGQFAVTNSGGNTDIAIACFRAGTHILTERGEVPVELLRVGMRVVSLLHRRLLAIKWIGWRRINCARHPRPADVWPVRVEADALAPGVPHRAVWLSPDHALFAGGRFIPVRHLVSGGPIAQVPHDEVVYFHVELEEQGVLFADGLPAESYLDTGNRGAFINGGGPVMLHADFAQGAMPIAADAAAVVAERERLLARARASGWQTTSAAGVMLVLSHAKHGQRDDILLPLPLRELPGERDNLRSASFELPPGAQTATLCSRATVPAQFDAQARDQRRLGIAVTAVELDDVPIALDDARLGGGWHAPEDGRRWTDGAARIDLHGTRLLTVRYAPLLRYWVQRPGADGAAAGGHREDSPGRR